jgi:threonine dehydratase
MIPSRDDIRAAARRIAPWVRTTPCLDLIACERSLCLKLEYLQASGTFKARGAFNRLLSGPIPPAGVVAASGGNHGIAVAHAARALGVRATVFVPQSTPAAKQARLRGLGAEVHLAGRAYSDAYAASQRHAADTGALTSHAYDHPDTVCGQATVGLEWQAQRPGLDTMLVAVGGGGLIAGIAAWFRGDTRVIAVESAGCPTLNAALDAGRIVDVEVGGLAADSLGAKRLGTIAFEVARRWVAGSVLVDDDAIARAQRWLWDEARIPAEPGGATAMAALLSGAYRPGAGERVGVLVCGANVDPATLARPEPA